MESLFDKPEVKILEAKLKEVRHRLFSAKTSRTKRNLKKRDEELRNEIAELLSEDIGNENAKLLSSWNPYDQNTSAPFFDPEWMFGLSNKNGGFFDIVIANPPYLKERDNAHFFDAVNRSAFGKQYHQGKMDFWYYFMHLAINISNASGIITFITSRYWINSQGAKGLINRIEKETSFISVIDFGKLKVFDNVAGHHMVHLYSKSKRKRFLYKNIVNDLSNIDLNIENENLKIKWFDQNEVFRNNEIIFSDNQRLASNIKLGDKYVLFQGIVEACDKISSKQFKNNTSKEIQLGNGVFVLSENELDELGLNEDEHRLIRRCLYPINVDAYKINNENPKFVIYSDRNSKELISKNSQYGRLKKHLDKFKNFITSSNKPYGLHRPRVLEQFEKDKIVFKCMFVENCFAIDYEKHINGMSFVNIIRNNNNCNYSLEFLLGLLNSNYAKQWFYNNGKKRGAGVDIGVDKLRSFPLPSNTSLKIVDRVKILNEDNLTFHEKEKLMNEIDLLVYKAYELSFEEMKSIDTNTEVTIDYYNSLEI